MSSSPAIRISDLVKTYGNVTALQHVSFEVPRGSIFGLIGPDGAGKTSLMRIACGLLVAQQGRIEIMGLDSSRDSARVKELLGYMPQRFSLYPDLSVRENLRFYADLHHVKASVRTQRETQLMEFSRLAPFMKRRAGQLSGGMKQKLALSCTLIHEPDVLILDEPTTGVDPVSRREFWQILKTTASQGRTILVSTPYMDEAALCDQIALIHKGVLLGIGAPGDIPNLFTRRLLEVSGDALDQARHALLQLPRERYFINRFGDRLHVIFDDAADESAVRAALQAVAVSVKTIAPSIEDTFVALMNQRAA